MKKLTPFFCAIFLTASVLFSSFAQDTNNSCAEKAQEYAEEFAAMLRDNRREDMPHVLFAWEQDCGITEPVFRARALQLIQEGVFPGSLESESMLDHAIAFEIRYRLIEDETAETRQTYFEHHASYFGYVPVHGNFDRQTLRQATALQNRMSDEGLAGLFLKLYSGQTEAFFAELKSGRFESTSLGRAYRERVDELKKKPELNVGLQAGGWFPMGNLSATGNHPSLGLILGLRKGMYYLDANFDFRFGNTSQDVFIVVKDTLVATRNHQGGYGGLELSRVFLQNPRSQWEWYAGAGYNLIEIVEDAREPERQSFGSWAFQTGPSFRWFFPNRTWLNVRAGFVMLNHKHDRGTPLDGNAFQLRIVYGFSENPSKSENLKRLGFTHW